MKFPIVILANNRFHLANSDEDRVQISDGSYKT